MLWSERGWNENGFSERHGTGSLNDVHEGSIENCSAPECQWPQEGIPALWPVDGRMMICKVIKRDDKVATVELLNGDRRVGLRSMIREVEWGSYCPHGFQLIEAVPAEHTCKLPKPPPCQTARTDPFHECPEQPFCPGCYPQGRKILPWACQEDGCTEADFDRQQQELEDEYHESMWSDYYSNR